MFFQHNVLLNVLSFTMSGVTCWQQPVVGCWKLLILLQTERAGPVLIQREDVNGQRAALQINGLSDEKSLWKKKVFFFFHLQENKTKNKTTTMCYHFIKINQNHRFHVLLQEVFIKLCPSVVSKNQAVAIKES